MPRRKHITNVRERVDYETGETHVDSYAYTITTSESYGFYRFTEGIDWTKNFGTGTDVKVLFFLLYHENIHSHEVVLSSDQVVTCAKYYSVNPRSVNTSLKALVKANFIRKIGRATYRINPYCFYIGGTNALSEKARLWDELIAKESKTTEDGNA